MMPRNKPPVPGSYHWHEAEVQAALQTAQDLTAQVNQMTKQKEYGITPELLQLQSIQMATQAIVHSMLMHTLVLKDPSVLQDDDEKENNKD